ncbi:unnamed protein product, partial [Rotaria magnacalcarata]
FSLKTKVPDVAKLVVQAYELILGSN